MERALEILIDDIIEKVEWDFYYNVYMPCVKTIKEKFNEIEFNHGDFKLSNSRSNEDKLLQ